MARKERKLISILKSVDSKQLNRFIKFVQSPYFNNNQRLIDFCLAVSKDYKETRLSESEAINSFLYINNLSDLEIRKVYSDALKLFVDFLGVEAFQQNHLAKKLHELKATEKYGVIEELYEGQKKNIQKYLERDVERGGNHFLGSYQWIELQFNIETEQDRKSRKEVSSLEKRLNDLQTNLSRFFVYESLRNMILIESWKSKRNFEREIDHKELILEIAETYKKEEPLIQIYLYLYELSIAGENEKLFSDLTNMISQHKYAIPTEEVYSIYETLLSYMIVQINQGNAKYEQIYFEFYQEALTMDGFYRHGILSYTSFNSFIVVGLRLGQYELVKYALDRFQSNIEPEIRENYFRYAYANLYFYQKDFDRVIIQLAGVEYDDQYYYLRCNTLLTAAYYELQEYEALDNMINKFQVFLSRERSISKSRKTNYRNFLKYVKKLSLSDTSDLNMIATLESQINETKGVTSKAWLREKVLELKLQ